MKVFILAVAALVACVAATPADYSTTEKAELLSSDFKKKEDGSYEYKIQISNGIAREEKGEIKEILDKDEKPQRVVIASGSYTLNDDKGIPHLFTYLADEFGFHVESDLLPEAPVAR